MRRLLLLLLLPLPLPIERKKNKKNKYFLKTATTVSAIYEFAGTGAGLA